MSIGVPIKVLHEVSSDINVKLDDVGSNLGECNDKTLKFDIFFQLKLRVSAKKSIQIRSGVCVCRICSTPN